MFSLTAYAASDSSKSGSSSETSSSSDEESSSSASPAKKGKVVINATGEGAKDDEGEGELPDHLKPIESNPDVSTASQMQIVSAPDVVVNVS